MKYYLQKQEYTLCKDEIYIQAQGVDENGYIEPVSAFCINYMSYGEMDTGIGKQAYSIIGQGRVERIIGSSPKELKEITKEEFSEALLKGENFKAILLQNPEIAILESAKNKIDRIYSDKNFTEMVNKLKREENEKGKIILGYSSTEQLKDAIDKNKGERLELLKLDERELTSEKVKSQGVFVGSEGYYTLNEKTI